MLCAHLLARLARFGYRLFTIDLTTCNVYLPDVFSLRTHGRRTHEPIDAVTHGHARTFTRFSRLIVAASSSLYNDFFFKSLQGLHPVSTATPSDLHAIKLDHDKKPPEGRKDLHHFRFWSLFVEFVSNSRSTYTF